MTGLGWVVWWGVVSPEAGAQAPSLTLSEVEASVEEASPSKVSVSFTDDFELRYWIDRDRRLPGYPDDAVFNYIEQVNRLTANVLAKNWQLDLQLDQVALFANRYELGSDLVVEHPIVGEPGEPTIFSPLPGDAYANLEKLRWTWRGDGVEVQLGDSYVAFGRGLALNLNRNVDIDIDTSVQGAQVVARPGAWDLTAVVGQLNRQQVFQDNANGQLEDQVPMDRRHSLVALRAERFGLGPANLGAHAVAYGFVDEPGFEGSVSGFNEVPDAVIGGGTFEFIGVAGLDGYLEGDAFHYTPDGDLADTSHGDHQGLIGGEAFYGSLAAYPGALVVLLEGKRYRGTAPLAEITAGNEGYAVATPPTLEYDRAITVDSNAALASNDITGGRLRVDWAAIPGRFVPYVSGGYFVDRDLTHGAHNVPETIIHPLLGLEWLNGKRSVLFNAGYRIDDRHEVMEDLHRPTTVPTTGGTTTGSTTGDLPTMDVDSSFETGWTPTTGADRQAHADVVVQVPLVGETHLNMNVAGEYFIWGENGSSLGETQSEYVEFETSMTFAHGPDYAVTWFCDYTTQVPMNTSGNLFPAAFEGGERPLYGAMELQWKPDPATTVKAFYGAYKSGIRCAGGQCRLLPGFEGARVALQSAF